MQTLAGALALLLAGCGGATKTVSVAGSPPNAASTASTPTEHDERAAAVGHRDDDPADDELRLCEPQSTRTATEPKFVEEKA